MIVHCLPVTNVRTFHEKTDTVFIPYLERQLQTTTRLYLERDAYRPDSLKESTRDKRWKEVRRSDDTQLKGGRVQHCPAGSSVYITAAENVTCIGTEIEMSSCNQEEADTTIMVHVKYALLLSLLARFTIVHRLLTRL